MSTTQRPPCAPCDPSPEPGLPHSMIDVARARLATKYQLPVGENGLLQAFSGKIDPDDVPMLYPPQFYRGPAQDALVVDIRLNGVLTPITLSARGVATDGHRRAFAAREAGLRAIPFVVLAEVKTAAQEVTSIGSTQVRSNRNPVDEARPVKVFADANPGMTQQDVARALNKHQVAVSRLLHIFDYPPDVIEGLGTGVIKHAHLLCLNRNGSDLHLDQKTEFLRTAMRNAPMSAAALVKIAYPPRRKAEPKLITLEHAGVTVRFSRAMSAEDVTDALEEFANEINVGLKGVQRKQLPTSVLGLGATAK